jgi:hypothetical protein
LFVVVARPDLVLWIQPAGPERFANLLLSIGVRMD